MQTKIGTVIMNKGRTRQMCSVTADQVASFFVKIINDSGDVITNLKLQKLLYYAQGWHLGLYDKPLFDDQIEAWVHGPVVRTVYNRFKRSGSMPINATIQIPVLPKKVKDHLLDVLRAYDHLSAFQLEDLTHSEAPWKNARRGIAHDENSNREIPQEVMKSFFKNKSNERKTQN
jgi:uncharacterized phage-associated protein